VELSGVKLGVVILSPVSDLVMADIISRNVIKQAGRAKEKILQNLGKADKTKDEIFEEHLQNFNTQQVHSTRLHKDINNYLRSIRAMQTASKNLMETLSDIYEKEWVGQESLAVEAQNSEMLWSDLTHKLTDQVVIPLNTYQAQFPEVRRKIEKRGRKLTDYDSERHAVQHLQNNPNRNEAKFVRAKEQMENAKRTYEVLNSELHDELPNLHDSRILFLVANMQTLFAAEEVFHSETSKVYGELETTVNKLSKAAKKGTLPRKTLPKPQPITNYVSNDVIGLKSSSTFPPSSEKGDIPDNLKNEKFTHTGHSTGAINRNVNDNETCPTKDYETVEIKRDNGKLISGQSGQGRDLYEIPSGATTDNLSPGVLYQVKGVYKYGAEDADELNFEIGDVIDVIEYEDPEEQEEGWLTGIKKSTGQKGLFPANFTKPI